MKETMVKNFLSEKGLLNEKNIMEMMLLQKKLNDGTNSPIWIFGVNHLDRVVNWLRCIHMEAAELLDSYPWKHWKDIKGKADEDNAQVELTDIWHFLLSYGIHTYFMFELYLLRKELEKEATIIVKDDLYPSKELDKDKLAQLIEENEFSSLLKALESEFDKELYIHVGEASRFYEEVVAPKVCAKILSRVEDNSSKKDDLFNKFEIMQAEAVVGSIQESDEFSVEDGLNVFSRKVMTFDNILNIFLNIIAYDVNFDLVKFYLGKNVLNQIRQDNGYKEGTYIKQWNGVEDNVYMLKAIADVPTEEVSFQVIYNILDDIYKKL